MESVLKSRIHHVTKEDVFSMCSPFKDKIFTHLFFPPPLNHATVFMSNFVLLFFSFCSLVWVLALLPRKPGYSFMFTCGMWFPFLLSKQMASEGIVTCPGREKGSLKHFIQQYNSSTTRSVQNKKKLFVQHTLNLYL